VRESGESRGELERAELEDSERTFTQHALEGEGLQQGICVAEGRG
jgi:hypothetical protein